MSVITLTTDFGSGDHEAGVLKGVIWNIAPNTHIVDLCHEIPPQDIFGASLLLWRALPYFPDGTIHVAVIDPGVGTNRRGIIAQIGSQFFVGPDNGTITLLLKRNDSTGGDVHLHHLTTQQYWLAEVSNVFHGRDIFAPVAAHLSAGVPIEKFGDPIFDPIMLDVPKPRKTPYGWLGQVIHIDHFGNLSTNINSDQLTTPKEVRIRINGKMIPDMVSTFGERPHGSLVCLLDSSGLLAISVVNGNAAKYLDAKIGDQVELFLAV